MAVASGFEEEGDTVKLFSLPQIKKSFIREIVWFAFKEVSDSWQSIIRCLGINS